MGAPVVGFEILVDLVCLVDGGNGLCVIPETVEYIGQNMLLRRMKVVGGNSLLD